MSSPIQRAIDATFKVFSRYTGGVVSSDSLRDISNQFSRVTKTELKIDPDVLDGRCPGDEAPVTYIRILESKLMTVAVFVLKQGSRLPLHDHPQMYGFLKVIHGKINIRTYSPLETSQYPVPTSVTDSLMARYGKTVPVYPMKMEGNSVISENDNDCCVLSPDGQNVHEITTVTGPAAFIDILTPPYNPDAVFNRRPCSYYRELCADQVDQNIRYLVKINPPNDYWCNEVEYTGPTASHP